MDENVYITEFDKEMKLNFMGDGEWIDEHDQVHFKYREFACIVKRIFIREPLAVQEAWFGGYLCCYVRIPEGHKYHNKGYNEMNIDCHGGLTYSANESDGYWIGFDCAHSMDIVPTCEERKINRKLREEFEESFPFPENYKPSPLFKKTYKNIQFCIDQCKSIVDQLIAIQEIIVGKD